MILTVTINPLLERRLNFKSIEPGSTNRAEHQTMKAGGKGINVSRQLKHLDLPNHAFTFIGGNNGKVYRQILDHEGINYTTVATKSDVRVATLTTDESTRSLTTYIGPDPDISRRETDQFIDRLSKMVANSSMVVFSGSSPNSLTDEIFPAGIRFSQKHDKISILDTYGDHLIECLNQKPFAVHNNVSEVEGSLGINFRDEKDKIDYLTDSYNRGIKINFLSDGAQPLYASNFGFHHKIPIPRIKVLDPTGSGDSMVAGMVYGFSKSLIFEDTAKLAVYLGMRNASSWDTCAVELNEENKIEKRIRIFSIGKKMKLINDSPNY
jgi:1-phosphofructokinase family hexose kinase